MPSPEKNIDLTCVGILVLDALGKTINEFPAEGTSVYYSSVQLLPGGCAFNTGVAAKRLGLTVSIQGRVGDDAFGDIVTRFLSNENIATDKIKRTKVNTAFSFVMIPDSGQRRIYNTQGANTTFCSGDIDLESIRQSKVVHVAGSSLMPEFDGTPTIELLRFCRENNTITSMDPVFKAGIADVIIPALPYLDIFLPNTEESFYITGLTEPADQLNFYIDNGVGVAAIKMGEKGVLISDGKDTFCLGAYNVPVADTCGAGDAFIAGFIYGRLNDWDVYTSAKFATATAAFCVQYDGATTGIPTSDKIQEFIGHTPLSENNYIKPALS